MFRIVLILGVTLIGLLKAQLNPSEVVEGTFGHESCDEYDRLKPKIGLGKCGKDLFGVEQARQNQPIPDLRDPSSSGSFLCGNKPCIPDVLKNEICDVFEDYEDYDEYDDDVFELDELDDPEFNLGRLFDEDVFSQIGDVFEAAIAAFKENFRPEKERKASSRDGIVACGKKSRTDVSAPASTAMEKVVLEMAQGCPQDQVLQAKTKFIDLAVNGRITTVQEMASSEPIQALSPCFVDYTLAQSNQGIAYNPIKILNDIFVEFEKSVNTNCASKLKDIQRTDKVVNLPANVVRGLNELIGRHDDESVAGVQEIINLIPASERTKINGGSNPDLAIVPSAIRDSYIKNQPDVIRQIFPAIDATNQDFTIRTGLAQRIIDLASILDSKGVAKTFFKELDPTVKDYFKGSEVTEIKQKFFSAAPRGIREAFIGAIYSTELTTPNCDAGLVSGTTALDNVINTLNINDIRSNIDVLPKKFAQCASSNQLSQDSILRAIDDRLNGLNLDPNDVSCRKEGFEELGAVGDAICTPALLSSTSASSEDKAACFTTFTEKKISELPILDRTNFVKDVLPAVNGLMNSLSCKETQALLKGVSPDAVINARRAAGDATTRSVLSIALSKESQSLVPSSDICGGLIDSVEAEMMCGIMSQSDCSSKDISKNIADIVTKCVFAMAEATPDLTSAQRIANFFKINPSCISGINNEAALSLLNDPTSTLTIEEVMKMLAFADWSDFMNMLAFKKNPGGVTINDDPSTVCATSKKQMKAMGLHKASDSQLGNIISQCGENILDVDQVGTSALEMTVLNNLRNDPKRLLQTPNKKILDAIPFESFKNKLAVEELEEIRDSIDGESELLCSAIASKLYDSGANNIKTSAPLYGTSCVSHKALNEENMDLKSLQLIADGRHSDSKNRKMADGLKKNLEKAASGEEGDAKQNVAKKLANAAATINPAVIANMDDDILEAAAEMGEKSIFSALSNGMEQLEAANVPVSRLQKMAKQACMACTSNKDCTGLKYENCSPFITLILEGPAEVARKAISLLNSNLTLAQQVIDSGELEHLCVSEEIRNEIAGVIESALGGSFTSLDAEIVGDRPCLFDKFASESRLPTNVDLLAECDADVEKRMCIERSSLEDGRALAEAEVARDKAVVKKVMESNEFNSLVSEADLDNHASGNARLRRKKRQSTNVLTCSNLEAFAGGEYLQIQVSQIEQISCADLMQCPRAIGNLQYQQGTEYYWNRRWKPEQAKAFYKRFVDCQSNGENFEMTFDEALQFGLDFISNYMTVEEIVALQLSDSETVNGLGKNCNFTTEQQDAIRSSLVSEYFGGSVSDVSGDKLAALGQSVGLLSDADIEKFSSSNVYSATALGFGELNVNWGLPQGEMCIDVSKVRLLFEKVVAQLGPIENWQVANIIEAGTLVGTVTCEELATIHEDCDKLEAIQPLAIGLIDPTCMSMIPVDMFSCFNFEARLEITTEQLKAISMEARNELLDLGSGSVIENLKKLYDCLFTTCGAYGNGASALVLVFSVFFAMFNRG